MSAHRTAWIAFAAFWTAFALLSGAQTWLAMITHGHSLPRILGFHVAVWWLWLALTPIVFFVARHTRSILLHVMAALILGIAHVALWMWLTILIQPFDAMTINEFGPHFPFAAFARLPFEIIIYAGLAVAFYALDYYDRNRQLERSLHAAQLHALELQIQPHFLFNTLNAVTALVRGKQNTEAVEVIAGLSDLLRYTLDHAGEQRVPLETEAAMLRRYLEIQQVRFSDRLEISIDVDDDARRAAVPTLILQPLAENAIRHGVAPSAAAGKISVHAFRDQNQLHIEMFNSGRLREDAPHGIGLRNTIERLRQLYAGTHHFELANANGGVVTSISIPWSEVG
jgi:two-component system, LytTR family, sensor kinase